MSIHKTYASLITITYYDGDTHVYVITINDYILYS